MKDRWKDRATKLSTIPPEVLARIPESYQDRKGGHTDPCPNCVHRGIRPPGKIRRRLDSRHRSAYYCRKCKLVVPGREIHVLRNAGILPAAAVAA